jgi:serine/threonine-protein kinase
MQQKTLNQRYELERKIGEGGMARVYLGRDTRLNRPIAVKVLHQHYSADSNFLARFHHEAQAAANLRHPNVVDVYDVGQDGDIHYIVMEYVPGQDLKAAILKHGSLPVDQAVSIARAVADGLEAAHRVGLVHRDIKPQNIIVGDHDQVKITDFGIAKSGLSTSATETGVIFGTADYLSPEQARGQTATTASDVYALGVTLYEMLTGRLPFTGDNAVSVAMQHVSQEPPPPRMYNPRIPPQLEALVLRALSKDPAQRPASAREFAQLLARYQSAGDQATVVRPAPPRPNTPPPNQQRNGPAPAPPQPRNPRTSNTRPQPTLPPRPVVSTPPQTAPGIGLGGVVLGVLLIAGVLGLVVLFMNGTFSDMFGTAADPTRPAATRVPTAAAPTEVPTAAPTETPAVPMVPVPNLIGHSLEDIQTLLVEARLSANPGAPRFSDTVAAGLVVDQWPRAGTLITESSVMTYAVSLGPEAVEIPGDLVGLSAESARTRLQLLGFKVAVQQEASDDIDRGFVIRISPRPPARPAKGSTVTLVVSTGNFVIVPDVFKLSEEEARQRIEAAGLFVSFVDVQGPDKLGDQFDSFEPGQVVSTDPRGGTEVRRGTGVTLGVRAP